MVTYVVDGPDGPLEHPTYAPHEVAWPVYRVGDAGTPRAVSAVPNPPHEPHYRARVGVNGTVYGLDTRTTTLLDGFEDGVWPGEWAGETSFYSVTTTAIDGSHSLQLDDTHKAVAHPGVETARDRTYSMRTVTDGASWAFLLSHVQTPSAPRESCYAARFSPPDDWIELVVYDGGAEAIKVVGGVGSVAAGTEYQVVLDVATDRVRARACDASGATLGATEWVADTRYATGALGAYAGSAGTGTRFDSFREHPLGVTG